MQKTIDYIASLIKLVLISLVIVLPVRYFLFQPFYVSGASMEPNLYNNEYLIIDEISYRFNSPRRGEIVVFKNPDNPKEAFIKRIIALPGERLLISQGETIIFNASHPKGFILPEPYLPSNQNSQSYVNVNLKLGADEYYVLGDNRAVSKDSRYFGPIKPEQMVGKVVFRGWPFDRVDLFGETEYGI